MKVSFHSFLISTPDAGQRSASNTSHFFSAEGAQRTHWIGTCLGPRIFRCSWKKNREFAVVKQVVYLHRLSCRGFLNIDSDEKILMCTNQDLVTDVGGCSTASVRFTF